MWQPPSQPPSHVAVAITLNAKASSLKIEKEAETKKIEIEAQKAEAQKETKVEIGSWNWKGRGWGKKSWDKTAQKETEKMKLEAQAEQDRKEFGLEKNRTEHEHGEWEILRMQSKEVEMQAERTGQLEWYSGKDEGFEVAPFQRRGRRSWCLLNKIWKGVYCIWDKDRTLVHSVGKAASR